MSKQQRDAIDAAMRAEPFDLSQSTAEHRKSFEALMVRPYPAPGIFGARSGGADEGAAVGGQVRQGRCLLRICAHQVEHRVESLPGHRRQERGGGVVDDLVRAVGTDPVRAVRAGSRCSSTPA